MKKIMLFFVAILVASPTTVFCNLKSSYRSNVENFRPAHLRFAHNANPLSNDVISTKNKIFLAAFGVGAIGIIGYVAAQVM